MITISVSGNFDDIKRRLREKQKQVAFAAAKALTDTARQAAKDAQDEMPRSLDRPIPFTVRGIRWRGANKTTLQSRVYIMPGTAAYLRPLIEGGVVRPKKRALLEPAGVKLDRYGNIPRKELERLRARKDVFFGSVRGIGGVWQRTKQGVKLLIKFESLQQKRKQFDFPGIVAASVKRNFAAYFDRALAVALATAR